MQQNKQYLIGLLLGVVLALNAESAVAEIRVLDQHGLTRAYRAAAGARTVQVRVESGAGAPILSNVDGILPEQQPVSQSAGAYTFRDIRDGTWQIRIDKGALIGEVRIIDQE